MEGQPQLPVESESKRVRPSAQRYELVSSSGNSSSEEEKGPREYTASNKFKRDVDSMRLNASAKELKFRNKLKHVDLLVSKACIIKCTKCDADLKQRVIEGMQILHHPLLKVLYCQSCCDYYGDGEFSLDEDGEDKYCRWCGEGGTLFCCSKCVSGFCPSCIQKHFGVEKKREVENDDNWVCFFCYPRPLWELRWICAAAIQKSRSIKKKRDSIRQIRLKKLVKLKRAQSHSVSGSDNSQNDNNSTLSSPSPNTTRQNSAKKRRRNDNKSDAGDDADADDDGDDNEGKEADNKGKVSAASSTTSNKDGDDDFQKIKNTVVNDLRSVFQVAVMSSELCRKVCVRRTAKLKNPDSVKSMDDVLRLYTKVEKIVEVLSSNLIAISSTVSLLKSKLTEPDSDCSSSL